MNLVFASNNKNKIAEIQSMLPESIKILSLEDINCLEDIPETADTIEGNAILKADYVTQKYGYDCFADDTGLEVEALNGEPGVYSARYAGTHRNNADNIALLLTNLKNKASRKARFRTVITLILDGVIHQFDGIVEGQIIEELRGEGGFGYDPVFVPDGYEQTFAEMTMEEKNKFSHRQKAVTQLFTFLHSI